MDDQNQTNPSGDQGGNPPIPPQPTGQPPAEGNGQTAGSYPGIPQQGEPFGTMPPQQTPPPPYSPYSTTPSGQPVAPPPGMFTSAYPGQPMGTVPPPPPGYNPFGYSPTPPPPPPTDDTAPVANFMFGEMTEKFQTIVKIPPHNLQFDESYFLKLLANSISLTIDEKKNIILHIPKLRQEQIDELIRILEEERSKFQELSPKHGEQLKKLEQKHYQDWLDFEVQVKAEQKASEDQAKADEIRKKLGL